MVDDVHISGTDVEWANEKTQAQILAAIKEAFKLDKASSQKLDKALSEAGKNGGFVGKDAKKTFKEFTTGLGKSSKSAFEVAKENKSLGQSAKSLAKDFKESSKSFKVAAGAAFGIGAALGKVAAQYVDSIGYLRDMTDVGANFTETHMDVSRILSETGMSMAELSDYSQKYTRVLAQTGLTGISKLVGKTEDLVGGFSNLGLTTSEATEFAMEYLDQQRMAGVYEKANAAGQAEAVQRNVERLTAFSKILNVSRKDLMQQSKEAFGREDVRRRLFAMEAGQRKEAMEAYSASIQLFGAYGQDGQKMGETFTDLMARLNPETSPFLKELRAAGAGSLAQAMIDMKNNADAGIKPTKESIEAMGDMAYEARHILDQIGQSGSAAAGTANSVGSFGLAVEESRTGLRDATGKLVNETVAAATKLEDGMNKLSQTALYLGADVLNELAMKITGSSAEGGVIKAMDALGGGFNDAASMMRDFADKPFGDAMGDMWGGIKDALLPDWLRSTWDVTNEKLQGVIWAIDQFNPWSNSRAERKARIAETEADPFYQARMAEGNFSRTVLDPAVSRLNDFKESNAKGGMFSASDDSVAQQQAVVDALYENMRELRKQTRALEKTRNAVENQS